MSWPTALKEVNNSSAGTADSVGGDDWDALAAAVNAHSIFEPYSYFIYKDGSNYKAKNGTTGQIISTNTSFNTVISAAITAMSSGGLLLLGPGDFSLTSALTITQNNLKIKGMGVDKTRILFNMGSTNAAFKVTGSVAASKNLTGNAAQFATTVVVGTVSPIVADDWIYLARNVQIDSGGSNAFDAEIHQVSSVTSTDIVLRDRIHAAYNTSATARVNKITWVTNFELEDLTMYDNRASVTSTTEGADTYFLFCKDLRINNVNFENGWYAAIGLQNCLDATLDNTYVRSPKIMTGDSNKRNYGIVAYAATTNLTINGYHCEKARHAFTTICIDSVGQTYHAGRQRNIQLNNCIGFNSNVSDWDTHEGCVGITFNSCGAIGNDPTLGANTDSKAFTTRSPTIFNSCWSEGAFSICATVDHFTAVAGTTDIPGGNRTQFNSCRFSLPIVDGVHTNRGIQITANRAGVIINGCYFNNIPDYAVEIGDNCSDIMITNNIFDSCGGSNTSSEGIIECLDDVTNLRVTNNNFSAGTAPANSRPLVVADIATGLDFSHNNVRSLTNKYPTYNASSTEITIEDNTGLNDSRNDYSYFLYYDSVVSLYKAKNQNGIVDYSNASLTSVIRSILNAASGDAYLDILIDKGYHIVNDQVFKASVGNFRLRGMGAGVTILARDDLYDETTSFLRFEGTKDGTVNYNLASNSLVNTNTVTVTAGQSANFSVGDYVKLTSGVIIDGGSGGNRYQGEIHKITNVDTGTGIITLDSYLAADYTTATTSKIQKIVPVDNITISDLSFTSEQDETTLSGYSFDIHFVVARNIHVKNVDSFDTPAHGICYENVLDSDIINYTSENAKTIPGLGHFNHYGMYVSGACNNITVSSCHGRYGLKHFWTSDGFGDGAPRNCIITGCSYMGGHYAPFGTHDSGDGIVFSNCSVWNSQTDVTSGVLSATGFEIRAPNTTVIGCKVSNVKGSGIHVTNVANGSNIIGNEIENLYYDVATSANGIIVSPSVTEVNISNNNIRSAAGNGIRLRSDNDNCIVSNNNIFDCGENAIVIKDNPNGVIVQNNVCKNNNRGLEMEDASDNCRIINNDFAENTAASVLTGSNNYYFGNTGINLDTLYRQYRPVAGADQENSIAFEQNNSSGAKKTAGRIAFALDDDTAGSEDGRMYLNFIKAGTEDYTYEFAPTEFSISDAVDIVLGTGTGTKIGTGTTQKVGFFNKAPVDQRTGIADVDASTVDTTYGAEEAAVIASLRTKLNAVLQVLEDLGLTAAA